MPFNINQTNGCDELSRVYGKMFAELQDVMQNEERFKELTPMDYSALGLYIGKFVEQEINSSVVQIMRAFCGIEMPEYYCKHDPYFNNNDADVKTNYRTIRLNEQRELLDIDSLKTIPLGDAYYAMVQLKTEDEDGFFDQYPWLNNPIFLEAWRKLFKFRNDVAHIGAIIDADTLKRNYEYFLRFLQFMPDILKAKKELGPQDYVDSLPKCEQKELPYFVSTDDTEKPHAPVEIAQRYVDLRNANVDERMEMEWLNEINGLIDKYDFAAVIFEGENHKKGLKDCLGNILVPAKYDGFDMIPSPFDYPRQSISAAKDGKYVLVAMDGSGKEFTKEPYDEIHAFDYLLPAYVYRKDGLLAWGLMDAQGQEMCDCIIDEFWRELNDVVFISGDRYGYWQMGIIYLPPVYDNIEVVGDPEDPMLFTLNGIQGYIKLDDKAFVSLAEIEQMDEDDAHDLKLGCVCLQYD